MSKRGIEFARPDEPSFLKKLKSKIGFQNNSASLDNKMKSLSSSVGGLDNTDLDDEQPVIVIPEDSNVTETDVTTYKEKIKFDNELRESDKVTKKILYKKPSAITTKTADGMKTLQCTSKKASSAGDDDKSDTSSKSNARNPADKQRQPASAVKNKCLLSFDDEEEDD